MSSKCVLRKFECFHTVANPPTASNAKLDSLSADGRVVTYSCDSALYELQGSSSIEYDEGSGWPDAPECKGKLLCSNN